MVPRGEGGRWEFGIPPVVQRNLRGSSLNCHPLCIVALAHPAFGPAGFQEVCELHLVYHFIG